MKTHEDADAMFIKACLEEIRDGEKVTVPVPTKAHGDRLRNAFVRAGATDEDMQLLETPIGSP
jgi:hypothetical protein